MEPPVFEAASTQPRVRSIPVLSGATRYLGNLRELREDRLGFVRRTDAECDGIIELRLLGRAAYYINSLELLDQVLIEKARSFDKSSLIRYMLYPLAGEGLFTSGGELWRRQRRTMAPIFQQREIAGFAAGMVECARRGMSEWQDGQQIDMARETTRIAMSIVGRALFDADTFDEADALGGALTVALAWASSNAGTPVPMLQGLIRRRLRAVSRLLPPANAARTEAFADRLHGPVLFITPRARRLLAAVRLLDERVARMIQERRASGLGRRDLLTRLLTARDETDDAAMSDRQVRDEVLTLFVAGHETTAAALAWSLDLLVHHPEIQARAQAEVDALGRPPSVEDLPRLAYLGRVFKEALRLYPPVYLFGRETNCGVEIGGRHFARGTVFFVSPYALHHRSEWWPDPETFDPDRFSVEAEASRPRLSYIPFSIGPRVCIGNHFALMEGQLVLATLLEQTRFEAVRSERVEPEPSTTLRPRGGIPLRVFSKRAIPARGQHGH
jgi:cytochrome P450